MGSYTVRDQGILQQINRAQRDIEELKNLQFIGSNNLKTYVNDSALVTSAELIQMGVYIAEYMYKRITFDAANQTSPFGRLAIDLRIGSPTNPAGDGSGLTIASYQFVPTTVGDGRLVWEVDLRGPTGIKFYAVFKVTASDYGTVSVADVGLM